MGLIYYLFIALVFLLGVIQSALLPNFRLAGNYPDLIVIVAVSWSLLRGVRHGILVALMGGIALDVLSGAPFGVLTLALVGAVLVSSAGAASFFRSPMLLALLAIVSGTIVYYLISLSLLALSGHTILWLDIVPHVALPALVVNTACMAVVFPIMKFLHVQTTQPEMEW